MNSNLELMIRLVGENQAESILADSIRSRFNGGSVEKIASSQRVSSVHKSSPQKSAIRFTPEEKNHIVSRARVIYAANGSWTKTSKEISQEVGNRTPASIYNLLWNTGLITEVNSQKQPQYNSNIS